MNDELRPVSIGGIVRKRAVRFDAESVRESWNMAAGPYSQGQAAGRDYYRYEFLGLTQVAVCGAVEGLRVLDVGCGNGYFAREMARRGARVTAIDIAASMIEYAQHEETTFSLGIEYRVQDATTLPAGFASGSFDMATACVRSLTCMMFLRCCEGSAQSFGLEAVLWRRLRIPAVTPHSECGNATPRAGSAAYAWIGISSEDHSSFFGKTGARRSRRRGSTRRSKIG